MRLDGVAQSTRRSHENGKICLFRLRKYRLSAIVSLLTRTVRHLSLSPSATCSTSSIASITSSHTISAFDFQVVLVQGHYLSYLPLCSRNEPVFLATCTPIAMPETRECVVQGATNVFTTIHSMDMKTVHMDKK